MQDRPSPDLEALVRKAGDLQVLPAVARKVIGIISDERASATDLIRVIERDQTITSRMLKLANSAFYGLPRDVTSLQQAVLVLGFRSIQNLVLAATTRSLFKRSGMTEQMLWDHSVGAALASLLLARGCDPEVQEVAFVGGLLHDLGKVVMNNDTPDTYVEVLMRTYNEGLLAVEVEQEIYGFTHAEVGAGVADKWQLPQALVTVIRRHHSWENEPENGRSAADQAIAAVNLADYICRYHGIGSRRPQPEIDMSSLKAARVLGITPATLAGVLDDAKKVYESQKALFA
jgi:putative nucleotidyltransferase with HDIG domain